MKDNKKILLSFLYFVQDFQYLCIHYINVPKDEHSRNTYRRRREEALLV